MGTNLECDVDVEGAVGMMDHGEDRDTHMPRKVDPRLRSRMAAPAPYTHWIGKGTPRRRKVPLELETARLWLSHPWECPCSLWHWLSRSGSSPVPPPVFAALATITERSRQCPLPMRWMVGILKELRRIGGWGSGSPLTRAFAGSKPLQTSSHPPLL
jgi:hypothetical protein